MVETLAALTKLSYSDELKLTISIQSHLKLDEDFCPPEKSELNGPLDFLFETISFLDPENLLRPWILNHPSTPEEVSNTIPCILQQGISSSSFGYYTTIALCIYSIGLQLLQLGRQGNEMHALHMFSCSLVIMKRISHSFIGSHIIHHILKSTMKLAINLEDFKTAVQMGTQLVALNDLILSDFLMDYDDYHGDDSSQHGKDKDPNDLDLMGAYECLVLLIDAAASSGDRNTLIYAYMRSLELILISERFVDEGHIVSRPLILENSLFTQLEICFSIVKANDFLIGDGFLSVKYCARACELDALVHQPSPEDDVCLFEPYKKRLELHFLAGKAFYKLALQLAGGISLSSSPPIAILAQSEDPSIVSLLTDSLNHLLVSQKLLIDFSSASVMQVHLQLAILYVELRQESNAKELLFTLSLKSKATKNLSSLFSQLRSRTINSADLSLLYSDAVIIRLSALIERPKLELQRSPSKDQVLKRMSSFQLSVQCSHCCMNVRYPIDCHCGANYCSEECMKDDAGVHMIRCGKGWF